MNIGLLHHCQIKDVFFRERASADENLIDLINIYSLDKKVCLESDKLTNKDRNIKNKKLISLPLSVLN